MVLFREQNKIREKNTINIQHVAKQQPCNPNHSCLSWHGKFGTDPYEYIH